MWLAKIAFRNITRNKRRSLLSASAITIAVFSMVFAFGLFSGMMKDFKSNLWTYITGSVRVRHADFDKYERLNPMHLALPDYESLIADIQEDPAVATVSPRINFLGRVPIKGGDQKVNVSGIGLNFSTEKNYQDYERTVVEGRLPAMGTREALVGVKLSKKLGVGIGDKFTVLAQSATRGSNAFTFKVVGLLSLPLGGLENTMVQVPLDTAQRFLWLPDQVQEILIKIDPKIDSPENVAQHLHDRLQSNVPLGILNYKQIDGMASMIETGRKSYDIIAIIFFLLASTVIINTTIMVIFERMKEIGTLGAMGMTGKQLVRLFFLESLYISLFGALIGLVLGIALTSYLGVVGFSAFANAMENIEGLDVSPIIYPEVNARSTLLVFVYALITSAIATWFPSRRAAKITPVDALRNE